MKQRLISILLGILIIGGLYVFASGMIKKGDVPVIDFIGISTGNLVTELDDLQFNNRFSSAERDLIAVVSFREIQQGTTVQATWFSPDDRRMPLGRTSIVAQSGAKVTRFSFASKEDWTPAPYMLRIDAMSGEGEEMRMATGAVIFYIGQTDAEIAAHQKDYSAWLQAQEEEKQVWEQRQQEEQALLERLQQTTGLMEGKILMRQDITQDGVIDYLLAETDADGLPSNFPGVVATVAAENMSLVDGSGSLLLSMKTSGRSRSVVSSGAIIFDKMPASNPIQVTVLPSATVMFVWMDKEQTCTLEVRWTDAAYAAEEPVCQ